MLGKSFKIVEPKRFDLYLEDIVCENHEAIVKINYAAICKADIRYYLGNRDIRILGLKYPMNLIHEALGTVILDKSKKFNVGDRVVLVPNIVSKTRDKCLHCICDDPNLGENYCPNAVFASSNYNGFSREYINYPIDNLIKIPDDIESNIAVFSELISVAISAYRRLDLIGNETIGIWGDGILGYIFCSTFSKIHSGKIIVIGKHKEKLKKFPVQYSYLIGDNRIKNENISVAYECVGGNASSLAIEEILENILVGGKIVLTGVAEGLISVNTRKILEKGVSIFGVTRSMISDFNKALLLLKNETFKEDIKKLMLSEMQIRNIVDYYKAFEIELNNKELGKNILHFDL